MRYALALVLVAACGGGGNVSDDDNSLPPDAMQVLEPVHLIGRFDDQQRFGWPGSAMLTRFDGTDLSIELDEQNGANWYDVTVDGTTTVLTTSFGDQTYPVATGLAAGEHDVRVARRTESFYGVTRFVGFSGGTLVDTPRPTRIIEFVGDSITCGYGVLGVGPSCSFSADTEAETHAYGEFTARQVSGEAIAIAYSGIGVYRNNGGEPGNTMTTDYERIFADDPSSVWLFPEAPAAVVINLGTNDFSTGDPGQPYVDAYAGFVDQIRGHYGDNVDIFLAGSPMLGDPEHATELGYLNDVFTAKNNGHIHVVDLATQLDSDGYGCDYHPNETTQHKMADATAEALRMFLGW